MSTEFTLFSDQLINFKIILPNVASAPTYSDNTLTNANEFSFLLKMTHGSNQLCSFLFSGDAEGINLTRIIGQRNSTRIINEFISEFPKSFLPNTEQAPTAQDTSLQNFHNSLLQLQKSIQQDNDPKSHRLYKANRKALNAIGSVFVPHHGTDTENSQRFISYLSDRPIPPAAFFVNSVVINRDNIPHRSTWEMVHRDILHPAHYFVYHNGTQKMIKLTKKRLYVTESAPGCVYWQVSNGQNIYLYNAYRQDPNKTASDLGFFPITPMTMPQLIENKRILAMSDITYKKPYKINEDTVYYVKIKGSNRQEKAYEQKTKHRATVINGNKECECDYTNVYSP